MYSGQEANSERHYCVLTTYIILSGYQHSLIIDVTDATSQVAIEQPSHNQIDNGMFRYYLAYWRNLSTH